MSAKVVGKQDVDSFLSDVIGTPLASLPLADGFPKGIDVMKMFFYRMAPPKSDTVAVSARQTARALMAMWLDQNKPTLNEDSVTARVRRMYETYNKLRKSHRRGGATFDVDLAQYKAELQRVLDIGSDTKKTPSTR